MAFCFMTASGWSIKVGSAPYKTASLNRFKRKILFFAPDAHFVENCWGWWQFGSSSRVRAHIGPKTTKPWPKHYLGQGRRMAQNCAVKIPANDSRKIFTTLFLDSNNLRKA